MIILQSIINNRELNDITNEELFQMKCAHLSAMETLTEY